MHKNMNEIELLHVRLTNALSSYHDKFWEVSPADRQKRLEEIKNVFMVLEILDGYTVDEYKRLAIDFDELYNRTTLLRYMFDKRI